MRWNNWLPVSLRSKTTATPAAPAGFAGVRLACDRFEDRLMPRPTLYVEFGDRFPAGGLSDTYGNLLSARSGTNPAVNGPDGLGNNSDALLLTPFDTVIGPTAAADRKVIMALVQRYYEGTNIEVVELTAAPAKLSTGQTVQGFASLQEASKLLGTNNSTQRHNDSIIFVCGISIGGSDLGGGGLLGISYGDDINIGNRTEGSALVPVTDPGANGKDSSNDAIDVGVTAAHEAGHAFGLKHAYDTSFTGFLGPAAGMYQNSELMSYITPFNASGEADATSGFFMRAPTIQGDRNQNYDVLSGAPGTLGTYDQYLKDPEVGPNPALEYVTGTGAYDRITIAKTSPTQATVTLEPFQDAAFTTGIPIPGTKGASTKFTYTIGLTKPILIDAGLRDDRVVIDASLGVAVTVRGQGGTDSVVIAGAGSGAAVYTPGTNATKYFDGASDLRGTVTVGATSVAFSEFEAGSSVSLTNIPDVTFASPGGSDDLAPAVSGGIYSVTGTIGGKLAFVPLAAANVTKFGIDVGRNDAATDANLVTLDFTGANPIPSGGLTVTGGVGTDTLAAKADADFTLAAATLVVGKSGTVNFTNFDAFGLTGGKSVNAFVVNGFAGAVTVTGAANDALRVTADTNFTLAKNTIVGVAGPAVTAVGVTKAAVFGGPGANTFTLAASTLAVTLDGGLGADTYVLDPASPTVTVAESGTDAAKDTIVIAATAGNDTIVLGPTSVKINAATVPLPAGGKIEAVVIDGGAGDDTFVQDLSGGLTASATPTFVGGAGVNTVAFVGDPGTPIALGSVTFDGSGGGRFVLDPDGSGGILAANDPGPDAFVFNFAAFASFGTTVPVARFDVPFSAADDAITVGPGPVLDGQNTLQIAAADRGLTIARAGRVVAYGGGGADSFIVTGTPGVAELELTGADPTAADDGAATTFTLSAAGVPVTLAGGAGDDAFTVGAPPTAAGGTDNITAAVTIAGGEGANTLTLSDYGSAAGNADVRVTAAGVSGLVGKDGAGVVTYTGITSLAVFGSNAAAAETFTVDGVGVPLELRTYNGTNTVVVSNVSARLSITTGAGDDTVTLTNVSQAAAFAVALGDGNDVFTASKLTTPALTIDAGKGNNAVVVAATGSTVVTAGDGTNTVTITGGTTASVTTGAGADAVTITGVAGAVTVAAGDGGNTVTVAAAGAVAIAGGAGADVVTVTAGGGAVAIDAAGGDNTIRLGGNVGTGATLNAGGGKDTFVLTGVTGPLTLAAGDGDNTITLSAVAVPGKLAIATGAGADTFTFADVTAPGGVTIASGGGADTLALTGITGPVAADAGDGNDMISVAAVAGTVSVTAGPGNDTIAVANATAALTIDAGADDDTITVGGVAAATIINAGAGNDTITVGGPSLDDIQAPLTIDAGAGTDTLTLNDSGYAAAAAYSITAGGVSRPGFAGLTAAGAEAFGLLGGSGANTYSLTGTPAGGITVVNGAGGGTFAVAGSALAGPIDLDGGSAGAAFAVSGAAGVLGTSVTLRNGTVALTATPAADTITYRYTGPLAGTVTGLGTPITLANAAVASIDGGTGANSFSLIDDSNAVDAITVSGSTVTTTTGPASIALGQFSAVTLNGDGNGSGDRDTVRYRLDPSTATVTVTDRQILVGRADGSTFAINLAGAGVAPTFSTVRVDGSAANEVFTVTPSNRVVLVVTGGPGVDVLVADTPVAGRTIAASTDDPAATTLTAADGSAVTYSGFETAPKISVIAVATGAGVPSRVRVYDATTGQLRLDITPYAPDFLGGVSVATGDVNGDNVPDVIVGAGPGGGPHVQIFDGVTGRVIRSFFAYESTFTGGVQVAAGDVDGDGTTDVVLGTGLGGGPRVQVLSGETFRVIRDFFAYEDTFRNGVQVAAGDIDNDGKADVVTGSGAGGGPRVRVFAGANSAVLMDFFAYDAGVRSGVNVAAGDLNGDGVADIVTGPGGSGLPNVKAFAGRTGKVLADFFLNDVGATNAIDSFPIKPGVRVGTADRNGDGTADILAGSMRGAGVVRAFGVTGGGVQSLDSLDAFGDGVPNGVFVG